jgi:hypothetical protein
MSSLPPPAPPAPPERPSPIVWVVVVIALLLAYAMFNRSGGDKTAVPAPAGDAAPAAPASGSSNSGLKIPEWVPIYPGTTPSAIASHSTRSEYYIDFKLRPNGGNCHQFLDYYDRKLNEGGFRTSVRVDNDYGDLCDSSIMSENPAHSRSINMKSYKRADGYEIDI